MSDAHAAGCLSHEALEGILAGTTTDPHTPEHLTSCSTCASRLEDLRQNNALMESVIIAHRESTTDGKPSVLAPPQAGTVTVAGYDIQSEIHRGGQGVVFKAYHKATKRTVALKVILQGALATSRQRHRFEREIEVVAALRHPRVVTVYDSGSTSDGQLFFAMEHVDGVSLDRYLLGNTPASANDPPHANRDQPTDAFLPVDRALELFSQICEGVIHAHRRGVMHRDLKPSNIMVDQDGDAHVLDFGLAKAFGDDSDRSMMTAPGEFMGTLAYAAPEQVQGDPSLIDVRTDVYSLGIVLYEMLTRVRPFEALESMSDVIRAITEVQPEPPSTRASNLASRHSAARRIDYEIDAIVLKALAKEPDRRYQSVDHFRNDIQHFLAGDPIDAKRDSKWYVLKKLVRRHKTAAAVITTFLLFTVGYALTMSVLYGRAIDAEKLAIQQASRATAINKFMVDMLESADPKGKTPSEMTIRELLDDIAAKIDEDLEDQPHVAAAVHSSVGNTYRNLALYEKAEAHLRASVNAAKSAVGENDADYASSLSDLGLLLNDLGQFDEAEKLLRETVALMRRHKGEDSTALATARGNLGGLLYAKGDFAGAEALFRKTLAHDRLHLDPDDPEIVFSFVNLAALSSANEHYDDAIALYREALELMQRLFGEEGHPIIATVMRGLAISLESVEDFDASESMHRKALQISRKTLGDEHPDIAEGMSNLAAMLREANRNPTEAERLFTEALAMRRKLLGSDHPNVAITLTDLAQLLHKKRSHEAAESMYREAIDILRKTFPEDHWEIAYVESPLAVTVAATGRFEEGERLLLRSHAIIEAERGATHAATKKTVRRIIDLYDAWHVTEPNAGHDADANNWRAGVQNHR